MSGRAGRRAVATVAGVWGVLVSAACAVALLRPPDDLQQFLEGETLREDTLVSLLVFPLAVSIGEAAAIMLVWSAVRSFRVADAPLLWCRRQRVALWACALGAVLAIGCATTADNPWTGMPPEALYTGLIALCCHSALALTIMIAISLSG
ncbi:hypothetical protein [Actinocorallia longicatena]|uniref:hypothetical protein n=1 Tax=Actinocorallia longicatena TaxID=111803 RepID=UPI0031D1D285